MILIREKGFELFIGELYRERPIFLTAEHASEEKVFVDDKHYVIVGDEYTGEIEERVAKEKRIAYLKATIPRSYVDFNRRKEDFGKVKPLKTTLYDINGNVVGTYEIEIHSGRIENAEEIWEGYHGAIDHYTKVYGYSQPKVVIPVHGMRDREDRPDLCLAVGKEDGKYRYLNEIEVKSLKERIEEEWIRTYGEEIKIGINHPFSHSMNEILRRYVYERRKRGERVGGLALEISYSLRKETEKAINIVSWTVEWFIENYIQK